MYPKSAHHRELLRRPAGNIGKGQACSKTDELFVPGWE